MLIQRCETASGLFPSEGFGTFAGPFVEFCPEIGFIDETAQGCGKRLRSMVVPDENPATPIHYLGNPPLTTAHHGQAGCQRLHVDQTECFVPLRRAYEHVGLSVVSREIGGGYETKQTVGQSPDLSLHTSPVRGLPGRCPSNDGQTDRNPLLLQQTDGRQQDMNPFLTDDATNKQDVQRPCWCKATLLTDGDDRIVRLDWRSASVSAVGVGVGLNLGASKAIDGDARMNHDRVPRSACQLKLPGDAAPQRMAVEADC